MAILDATDITEIARLQHLGGRYRAPMAVLLAALSVRVIGPAHAGWWIAAVLACELWTWASTRAAMTRALTTREMIWYIVSGAATMPAWAALGVMFWYTPSPQDSAVAVALWVGQLLYTQRFIFQSYLAVLMGNSVMVATMVVVPFLHPAMVGAEQVLFEIGLLFCVAFTVSGSLAAYARIRSLAAQNEKIERAAVTDHLTGLPNRAHFSRSLDLAIAAPGPTTVLYMDLDRFKNVNDTLGHQAGDNLLRQFAGRLLEISPPGATVARLGGDEFAAVISGSDFSLADTEATCRRIVDAAKAPFPTEGGQAYVGVSIGIARCGEEPITGSDLMRRADIALYTVKGSGRAGYHVFSDDLETEVSHRATIEAALRETLAEGQGFSLAYQAKVDRAGRVTSVEALARWSLQGRPVSPAVFVPIAEETGLILPLGDWVLREAVAFAVRWPSLTVAVNLSPVQLRDAEFAGRLRSLLAESGLDPRRLELEVTETALFDPTGDAVGTLEALRALGLKVALDDFGTGYSSLRHLHSLSVDRVKIDRSFVDGLGRGAESAAIISAVVQLGHTMGIEITAEGVETASQRDFLIEAGADELQGFLFFRPVAEHDLVALLRRDTLPIAA